MKLLPAAFLALLLMAASGEQPLVRYEPHHFADCKAAAFYATDHPTVGHYQYRVSGEFVHAKIRLIRGLGYEGAGNIKYSLSPKDTVMILPLWTWPHM
ncbi:MAG: hypothetical protein M3N19_08730, partial [Candidatus Eremiobacteraeota bacterium]|nr:hypothetical protein [Candidatus Eremiobacteraeota bacterium]